MKASAVRFHIVMPTVGRATLADAIGSLKAAGVMEDDTLHIVWDGDAWPPDTLAAVREAAGRLYCALRVHTCTGGPHGDWGATCRNQIIEGLRAGNPNEYILYLDDDDALLPGALPIVRRAIADAGEGRMHVFRMDCWANGILWREQTLGFGTIGGPMFVASVEHSKLGLWTDGADSDHRFINAVVAAAGVERLTWHEELIYSVRHFTRGASVHKEAGLVNG